MMTDMPWDKEFGHFADKSMDGEAFHTWIESQWTAYKKQRVFEQASSCLARLQWRVDQWFHKNEAESLEDSSLPWEQRVGIVARLDRMNRRSFHYHHVIKKMSPILSQVYKRRAPHPIRILDIGSGYGGFLDYLYHWATNNEIAVELHGLDCSPEFVTFSQQRLLGKDIPAQIHHGDASDLKDFENESMDVVVSNYLVHHLPSVPHVARFFAEVYRVSAGGWVLVDVVRCVRSLLHNYLGYLVGANSTLVSDGAKSCRRAYRVDEVNFLLSQLQHFYPGCRMRCEYMRMSPHWLVRGFKREKV